MYSDVWLNEIAGQHWDANSEVSWSTFCLRIRLRNLSVIKGGRWMFAPSGIKQTISLMWTLPVPHRKLCVARWFKSTPLDINNEVNKSVPLCNGYIIHYERGKRMQAGAELQFEWGGVTATMTRCKKPVHCRLISETKDTIHPIFKFQSCSTNDPFPDNIGILLWFGLLFLGFLYCAFLETVKRLFKWCVWMWNDNI